MRSQWHGVTSMPKVMLSSRRFFFHRPRGRVP
ncbi:hypothetical protein M8C21_027300, partial [Ambrosia artemisiifolia]